MNGVQMSASFRSVRTLIVGFAAGALACLAACAQPTAASQWELAPVTIAPVALSASGPPVENIGELVFKGGVEIKAARGGSFGGVSGLHVDASDRLLGVTDQGAWIAAAIERDGAGRMIGLADVKIAAMRGLEGQVLDTKRWADAEDLTRLPDGRYAVSFEQVHRIWTYDLEADGPSARAMPFGALGGADVMLANEGLEGIAALPDGRLLGVAEFPPRGDDAPYWLIDPASQTPSEPHGGFALTGGYGLVGLAPLPNGDVIALERFYLPVIGVRLTVKLIEAAKLAPDNRRIDGRVIAAIEPPLTLDNFEAVSAVPTPDGKIRLFIISDNNFSANQRTLLYAFEWTPPASVAAAIAPEPAGGIEGAAIEPGAGVAQPAGSPADIAAALAPPAAAKPAPPVQVAAAKPVPPAQTEGPAAKPPVAKPPASRPAPRPSPKPPTPTPEPVPEAIPPPPPPAPVEVKPLGPEL
jgi:hypothetical protein